MIAPQTALADIGDDLVAAAESSPELAEALEDYREACRRLDDRTLLPKHRAEWSDIHDELIDEIRRLFRATTA